MLTIRSLLYSEFIGEDGNEKFWQFVDTVKELTVYKHGGMLFVIAVSKRKMLYFCITTGTLLF